jgi:hypothetical protein
MTMRSVVRFYSLLGMVLLAALTASVSAHDTPAVKPRGELMASVKVVGNAFGQKPKGKTGWEFYVVNVPGVVGPMLDGFHYQDGELIDYVSAGSVSKDVVDAVNAVGLRPFDFAAAVKSAPKRMDTVVLDGTNVEIRVMTPSGELRLQQWNPGTTIDGYAPYSSDIGKLKAVLDILALYIGRSRMGI